jgi:hypothetical protein
LSPWEARPDIERQSLVPGEHAATSNVGIWLLGVSLLAALLSKPRNAALQPDPQGNDVRDITNMPAEEEPRTVRKDWTCRWQLAPI